MKRSLKTKISAMIIVSTIIIGLSFLLSFSIIEGSFVINTYKEKAMDLAATMAKTIDSNLVSELKDEVTHIYDQTEEKILSDKWGTPEFEEYVAHYDSIKELPQYRTILDSLTAIKDINHVDSLYIGDVLPEGYVIYCVDASEDPCPPGCLDILLKENAAVVKDPSVGFPPYTTNMSPYGKLVTAGAPIYNGENVSGYVLVDISLADIQKEALIFILVTAAVLFAVGVFSDIAISRYLKKSIVEPITMLSNAAANYQYTENEESTNIFKDLEIHSGDEIENLLDSMKTMEETMNSHVKKLISTRFDLDTARRQMIKIEEMDKKDSLTGIRNRTAYADEIRKLDWDIDGYTEMEFGIAMIDLNFLKRINDIYGHENGNKAIVKLCQVICKTFAHSPVFRIGGDEFAVILKGEDFNNRHKLTQIFKDRLKELEDDRSLPQWEQPSAAIGVAIYDAKIDKNADNVLKRADENMYKEKRAMKAIRD